LPGDLDLFTLELVRITDRVLATFILIWVFMKLFVLDLWANTCQTHHVTLRPWRLWCLSVIRVFVLCLCIKFEDCRHSCSENMTHPLSALVSLVTLTFSLLISKQNHGLPGLRASILPIFKLGRGTSQTNRQLSPRFMIMIDIML